jgi:hypothetical protein
MPGGDRYLIERNSSMLLNGLENQPSGSGPIGCIRNGTTFRPMISWVSLVYSFWPSPL